MSLVSIIKSAAISLVFAFSMVAVIQLSGGVAFAGTTTPPATPAAAATPQSTVCDSIGSGTDCGSSKGTDLTSVIKLAVNILSVVAGLVAVIMIIVAGMKYMTSGGDSGKVSSAKMSLVYAIIGLIIVVLSQFIVQFVIGKTTAATATTGPCPAGQTYDSKTKTCK